MAIGNRPRYMKSKWFPRPHDEHLTWDFGLETGANNYCTILPVIMNDEGLGSPSGFNSNPQHASFAATDAPNCYPESKIVNANVEINMSLTKAALETDKVHAVHYATMPIAIAFKDNYTAIDELSSNEIQDVLELQTEATDRQGYPLWNGVDMTASFTNSSTVNAAVPGLTTDQKLEGVTFNVNTYYDALQYMTIQGKLKKVQHGLKWRTLTRHNPSHKLKFHLKGGAKAINEYTFFGILVCVPPVDDAYQFPVSGETTNVSHVRANAHFQYNEWNENFDHERV